MTPAPNTRPLAGQPSTASQPYGSRAYAAYALGLLTLINLFNYADRNVVFAVFERSRQKRRFR